MYYNKDDDVYMQDDEDWEDDDGYDWTMIEDLTGEELSQEDKDDLNDMVQQLADMRQSATKAALGVLAGVSAFVMSQ